MARAVENGIVFVYCNAAGKLKTSAGEADDAIGNSQICVPIKGVLKRLDHDKEEMFIQEVDTNILDDEERAYRIRKDLKERILY